MKSLRVSVAGFGFVGRGFVELLGRKQELLRQVYDIDARLVGVGNSRGFIYREDGLDIATVLELGAAKRPLSDYERARHWVSAVAGLSETGTNMLVEAIPTDLANVQPSLDLIVTALGLGAHVVTANKGPGALAALDLLALAKQQGVQLRMESSVMAGTPVLSTILEGMAGATVQEVRGILNGTTNFILTNMAEGRAYADVLAEAQQLGYAETDPTADVEGYDTLAKTLILAALVFHQPLKVDEVKLQGITGVTLDDVKQAASEGKRIKLIAAIKREGEQLLASVLPQALLLEDPLARVSGSSNALSIRTDTLGETTIIGAGAGAIVTAQGMLADMIACVK
jgi:homoserine dehydrogenase